MESKMRTWVKALVGINVTKQDGTVEVRTYTVFEQYAQFQTAEMKEITKQFTVAIMLMLSNAGKAENWKKFDVFDLTITLEEIPDDELDIHTTADRGRD